MFQCGLPVADLALYTDSLYVQRLRRCTQRLDDGFLVVPAPQRVRPLCKRIVAKDLSS